MLSSAAMRGLATAAIAALVALACNGNGPTSNPTSLVLSGVVSAQSGGNHDVRLSRTGNLRVTLTDVRPVLLDVTAIDPSTLAFDVGIGTPSSSGCALTYSAALIEGGVLSFGLDKGNYCLTVTDAGLPEDSTVAYTLLVEVSQ